MATQKERFEFLSVLAQEKERAEGADPWRIGRLLMRHARTLGRYAEYTCNVAMTDRQTKWMEHREALIEKRMVALYRELFPTGKGIEFSGDPRGYTVKIFLPSERYNTWGGKESGWGVPQ